MEGGSRRAAAGLAKAEESEMRQDGSWRRRAEGLGPVDTAGGVQGAPGGTSKAEWGLLHGGFSPGMDGSLLTGRLVLSQ